MAKSAAKVNTERKYEVAIHALRAARAELRNQLHSDRRALDQLRSVADLPARQMVEARIERIKAETDDLTAAIVALMDARPGV